MKYLPYLVAILGTSSALGLVINTQPAQAQVAYGSYVGVGELLV